MENESQDNQSIAWSVVTILVLLLIIAIIIIIFLLTDKTPTTPTTPVTNTFVANITTPTPTQIPKPTLLNLNKLYVFPINDSLGTKVGEIQFTIKDVERTTEVMVGANKATAVGNHELILLNIELTNPKNISALVNTRNYLRLKVNGEDKLIAPEFHGDPVDLQAQSTKDTRVAFSILKTDTNLILQVGELDGPKDIFPLEF